MSTLVAKSTKPSLGSHLKKQNVFFYFSAITSVLLILMLFVPWIIVPAKDAGIHWTFELLFGFIPSLRSSIPAFLLENNAVSMFDLLVESSNIHTILIRLPDLIGTFISNIPVHGIGAVGKLFTAVWALITSIDLLVFLTPVFLGIIIVHVLYLLSIFRPQSDDVFYPGTVTVLLAGITLFLLLFGSDLIFKVVVNANLVNEMTTVLVDGVETEKEIVNNTFTKFLGLNYWTPVPYVWFVLTLIQKWLFAKLAHKKEVISYV